MGKRTERLFGLHTVKQLLSQSPNRILNVWLQTGLDSEALQSVSTSVEGMGLGVQRVPRSTLDKMTNNQNHQGVVIEIRPTAAKTEDDLDKLLASGQTQSPFFLVLDSIQDPHNLGACMRTADAAGVTAIIIPNDRAASLNETVRKVASGAAETMTVINVVNLVRALKKMKEAGVWLVGTTGEAKQSLYDIDLKGAVAIVMGGEGKGLRASVAKECDFLVNLPMLGQIESLNVSVATGICLYEVLRQRR